MIGINWIYRLSGTDGRNGLIDKETTGDINVGVEKGFNLFIKIWKIQTDDGGDRVFKKLASFLSDHLRSFFEVATTFGMTNYTIADQLAKHISCNLTSVFPRREMGDVLRTGDDG